MRAPIQVRRDPKADCDHDRTSVLARVGIGGRQGGGPIMQALRRVKAAARAIAGAARRGADPGP